MKCDRGKHVPKDRDPNIVAKWKSKKKCELGDSAIHEKSSIVTILRRPTDSGGPGNAGEIRLETQARDLHVGFKAPVLDTSTVWTLPPTDGAVDQRLITNGLGQLEWADCCSGGHQPVVNGDFVCLRAGETKSIDVLENDVDVEDPNLEVGPQHGVISFTPPPAFVYTANRGYLGCDSFTYHASNTQQQGTVLLDIVSNPPAYVEGDYRFIFSHGRADGSEHTPEQRMVKEYHEEEEIKDLFYPFWPGHPFPDQNKHLIANGLATNREDNLIYYCWRVKIPNPTSPDVNTITLPAIFACDYLQEAPGGEGLYVQFLVAYITGGVYATILNAQNPYAAPFGEVIDDNDSPSTDGMGPAIGADFASVQGSKVLYLAGEQRSSHHQDPEPLARGHYRIVLGEYDGQGIDFSQTVDSVTWVPWIPDGEGEPVGRLMGDLTYNPITGGLLITSDGNSGVTGFTVSEVDAQSGAEISPLVKMTNWESPNETVAKESEHQSTWDASGALIVSYKSSSLIEPSKILVAALSGGTGYLQGPRKEAVLAGGTLIDMAQWISQPCTPDHE